MSYRQRLTVSATLSIALNTALLALPWSAGGARLPEPRAPIILNFEQESPAAPPAPEPTPEQPPQAIETTQEATRPVESTNFLSDKNANAADLAPHDGTHPGPRVEEEDELVSVPMPPPAQPETASERTPQKNKQADREDDKDNAETNKKFAASEAPVDESGEFVEGKPADDARKEEALLARANPAAASDAPRRLRGKLDGRVMEQGFVGFEAIRDDVAAYYLEHVKPLVRRNWITNMLARYSGTMRAVAEVEMAISPDGALAYAEIRGKPTNRIFAALCKLSIEQAAPFKPFPFRVPPEYRDQNLVVHCTFHWQ